MANINEDTVRELAAVSSGGAPVVSCYLDVDGSRYPRRQDYEAQLETLVRRARARANGDGSVAGDLTRIADYVHAGLDRTETRGLALFSCEASSFWKAIPLAVPVRNQVVVNPSPAVGQLELLLHTYERIGVLLVDREKARLFVYELGVLVDRSEFLDELPRDYDHRGERERGDTHGHVDDLARFVSPQTIVLALEDNPADANYRPTQDNHERLRGMTDQHGRKLDIVTLPMPEPLVFRGQRLPASYANFYIAAQKVLVPTFNDPADRIALGILSELFPEREVVGIHAVDLVWGLGTLHCMTQQQPQRLR